MAGEGFREMLAVALREIQTSRRIFDELKEKATSSPMRVMAEIVVADQALWEVAELGRVLVEAAAGPDSAARGHRLGRLIHFAAESLGRAHDAMPKVDRGWGGEDRTFEEVLTEAMEPLNKLMDAEIPGTLAAGK